jgi:hypothetical protein
LDDSSNPTGETPGRLGDLGQDFILVVRIFNQWLKLFNKLWWNGILLVILTLLKELRGEKLLLGWLPIVNNTLLLFTSNIKH